MRSPFKRYKSQTRNVKLNGICNENQKLTIMMNDLIRTRLILYSIWDKFEFPCSKKEKWQLNSRSIWLLMNFYPNTPQIFLLKQRVVPFTVLQIHDLEHFLRFTQVRSMEHVGKYSLFWWHIWFEPESLLTLSKKHWKNHLMV